jgi:hypothetical protein
VNENVYTRPPLPTLDSLKPNVIRSQDVCWRPFMDKLRWADVLADPLYIDKWVALSDCDYKDDVLHECVVVDSDADIAVLQQRLEEQGIKNCTIKRVSETEEGEAETPRISRSPKKTPEP